MVLSLNSKILKFYYGEHNTDNWDIFLDDCMAAINAAINRSVGETQFYALNMEILDISCLVNFKYLFNMFPMISIFFSIITHNHHV